MKSKEFIDKLEYIVTGACIEVHKFLGPGMLESLYKKCLITELLLRDIKFVVEKSLPLNYKGTLLDTTLRADFLIEDCLILEIKAVEILLPVHDAQTLSYMKLFKVPKGILINFNCTNIVKNGKRPFVNEFYTKIELLT